LQSALERDKLFGKAEQAYRRLFGNGIGCENGSVCHLRSAA
jgi:hypothetical protein